MYNKTVFDFKNKDMLIFFQSIISLVSCAAQQPKLDFLFSNLTEFKYSLLQWHL